MVKKLRFQENRNDNRKRRELRERWVLEPLDVAMLAAAAVIVVWLQWLFSVMPG